MTSQGQVNPLRIGHARLDAGLLVLRVSGLPACLPACVCKTSSQWLFCKQQPETKINVGCVWLYGMSQSWTLAWSHPQRVPDHREFHC